MEQRPSTTVTLDINLVAVFLFVVFVVMLLVSLYRIYVIVSMLSYLCYCVYLIVSMLLCLCHRIYVIVSMLSYLCYCVKVITSVSSHPQKATTWWYVRTATGPETQQAPSAGKVGDLHQILNYGIIELLKYLMIKMYIN